MLPPGADINVVQATYESGGAQVYGVLIYRPLSQRAQCSCRRADVMPTDVHMDAVLIVKLPKTEEYQALQPKKVQIT